MKARVIKEFVDGQTNIHHRVKTMAEFDDQRAQHLADLGYLEIVQVAEKPKTTAKKPRATKK